MPTIIDSFPANQAFYPPALSGGVIVPTARNVNITQQAFPPAPLVNPFPIEPTPPARPTQVVLQAFEPVPVDAEIIPFNPFDQDVDPSTQDLPPLSVQTFTVCDAGTGNFATNPSEALIHFTVASVVDNDSGLPASTDSVNVQVRLFPVGPSLVSYGVSLVGRVAQFAVTTTSADRTILANNAHDFTVPVTVGVPYLPVIGDLATVAGATYNVVNVLDAITHKAPTINSVQVIVTVDNGSAFPSLVGQNVHFVVVVTNASRPILLFGDFVIVLAIKDSAGVSFLPVAGDDFAVDSARYASEVVSQLTGQVQNVIPSTNPLLDEMVDPSSFLPVQNVLVGDQVDVVGRPLNVLPYPNRF
jgi:hypothetical protein